MSFDLSAIPEILRPALEQRLARLGESACLQGASAALDSSDVASRAADAPLTDALASGSLAGSLPMVWACSDFVADACLRDASLLPWLGAAGGLDEPVRADALESELAAGLDAFVDDSAFMDALRRFRRRWMVRIAWRDLAGLADVETVLRELSLLADTCIHAACVRAAEGLAARHGRPRGADGRELELLVLGMGKLGGGELNFSSDIDLVLLFPEHGETDGPRPLAHEEYFIRVGRRLAQFLGTATHEGFVYRVDLRLRPFGDSGPRW